jgi:hypothetical protein
MKPGIFKELEFRAPLSTKTTHSTVDPVLAAPYSQ